MGSNDPIFVFKQHFSRSDAEAVVSGLIHHRAVWNRLASDGFLENLLTLLPAQKENWNAALVCLAAGGYSASTLEGSRITPQALPQNAAKSFNIPVEQIPAIAAGLLVEQTGIGNWADLLKNNGLNNLSIDVIQDGWGTVFTLAYSLVTDKASFLQEFIQAKEAGMREILAFILCANPGLLENQAETIQNTVAKAKLFDVLELLKKMDLYESGTAAQLIADAYLAQHPLEEPSNTAVKSSNNNGEKLLRSIELFRNYAVLANYSSQKELAEDFSKRALRSSDQLSQMLTALNKAIQSPAQDPDNLASKLSLASNLSVAGKALQAFQIKEADPDSARKIGKQIFHEIMASRGMGQVLADADLGAVISPAQLVNLLTDLNLIQEASQCADRLIEFQPLNADLLRSAALLNDTYGDFLKSAQLYSRLDLLAELSREEKQKLIGALEHNGQWQTALEIWKRINLVSLDDYEKKAICCYRSGDVNCFHETVKAAGNFYSSEGLFHILDALFDLDNGRPESAQKLVEVFLANRKRDRYSIYFLIEYYQKTGQFGEANSVIKSLSSLEMNSPEIMLKRYELAQQSGDSGQGRHVLELAAADTQVDDLASIEKLLGACFESGALDCAAEILRKTSGKWVLAPQLTALNAQLLNEQGKYVQARDLLKPLLSHKEVAESWLVQYGLAVLESRQSDFPLDIIAGGTEKSNPGQNDQNFLFEQYPQNLFVQVIAAELDNQNKLAGYQSLLNDKDNHLDPEIWRVHAGLGKYYFEHGQFDLAVVNFKEAAKAQSQKKALNIMLLKSLGRLSLYDEAMAVFSAMLAKGELEIADMLEINASLRRSDQWLLNLEKFAAIQPDNTLLQIALAQLLAQKGEQQKALGLIRRSGLASSNAGGERLVCAQILLQAGLADEARRSLEGFLSGKNSIQDSEYLSAAFLYLQMGETRKSLNLLNLIEHANAAVLAFKAQLFDRLAQPCEALAAVQIALEISESQNSNLLVIHPLNGIQEPVEWQRFNGKEQSLLVYAIELRIANNDYQGAYQQALAALDKSPDSFSLRSLSLELARVLGELEMVQNLLDDTPDWNAETEINGTTPVWGEAALQFGQEVLTANVLSRCLEVMPDDLRVKALQARLLERNGNHADAEALIQKLLEEWRAQEQAQDVAQNSSRLWLAEAALELRHYSEAMQIAGQAVNQIGLTTTIGKIFLQALVQASFNNWLKGKLEVQANLDRISEDDLACFNAICASEDPKVRADKEISALIQDIRFWLGKEHQKSVMDPAEMHPYVQLAATYQNDGSQKANILFDNFRDDPQAWKIMATQELDDDPSRTVEQATALLRGGQADPLTYALLAFGKQNLGQAADAYAALNLALSAWPEEYKWQLRAGELSKSLGDVRASLEHFKKAADTHKDEDTQVYLGELSLKTGSQDAIAYLEKKLNGSQQDLDVLLQLGELSIKNNKPQKAARYLESARKLDPKDARSLLLLSKVALSVENYDKAHELISEADQLKPQDKHIVLQKAAVMAKRQDDSAALDYLQHMQSNEIQRDADVIIRQAEYMRAANGAEKALEFLLPKSFDSDNSSLLLATAKNYLEMGKYDLSEEFAERALQADAEDAQPLAMLAGIAGRKGDLDKAVDLLVKAIQNDPFDASFYMDLARIYQNRRDIVKATETLQDGLRSIPQNFDLSSALGMLYYQQGQYHLAQEALQQAAAINPRDENIKRLLSTLTNANIIQGKINNDTLTEKA
jgi:tetratricopeptide (TPR) repeat protein